MDLPQLPVLEIVEELKAQLTLGNQAILQAPPGAGKSTLLPLALLNEPWLLNQKIIVLEPRRLAARAVAARMASLLGEPVGKTIGYRVRFETKVSSATRIEVVTEGILTRMLQSDNALEGVGLVVFDEFHERNIHSDLSLALCLQCQQVLRTELRLLVMSATLEAIGVQAIFKSAKLILSKGRQYPVEVEYLKEPNKETIDLGMARLIVKALQTDKGDVLAFLPGAREIKACKRLLEQELGLRVVIRELYGDLPFEEQELAILPDVNGRRKVVLATPIAETSLTIEGISIVVDAGLMRSPRYDVRSGLTKLTTLPITQDAAEQRAGRAGRLGPGKCYRLWTMATQVGLLKHRNPEISDADLAPLLLELLVWGVKDPSELEWATVPPAAAIGQAKELLIELGAISGGQLTEMGKKMAQLPCHPRLAHLILKAKNKALGTDIAALLEEKDPLGKDAGCDFTLRVEALRNWRGKKSTPNRSGSFDRIEKSAQAFRKLSGVAGGSNEHPTEEEVGWTIALAYPERIARKHTSGKNRYKLANGRIAKLPENDLLENKEWLAIAQMDAGTNEGRIFLAAPIDKIDLIALSTDEEIVTWDESRQQVIGFKRKKFGGLVLEETTGGAIDAKKAIALLVEVIKAKGLAHLFNWTEEVRQLQSRVCALKKWRPLEPWPDLSMDALQANLDEWLLPYLVNKTKGVELKELPMKELLSGLIPYELLSKVDVLAPSYLLVPSGSKIAIDYFESGKDPEISVRLQEIFGLLQTPTVNEGRIHLLIHLLSPARRPVQVTQDLMSFWSTTYQVVRKELKIRYPRHAWPEDPFTAEAVKGPIKKRLH